jgi:hypothetical protein
MAQQRDHDWGFWAYAANGLLIAFGFVTGFSIGIPFLLLGLALLPLTLRKYDTPADLGLLLGFAPALLLIAASGVEYAEIWAAVGATLAVASTSAFWWLRCRPARPSA